MTSEPRKPQFEHSVNPAHRDRLAALEDNWDGYQAPALTEESLKIMDTVWIVPTVQGGWQIEIRFLDRDVEIECSPDGSLASMWTDKREGQ